MITDLDKYNLGDIGASDLNPLPVKVEVSEEDSIKIAGRRACGVIRDHFDGRMLVALGTSSNTYLQDALKEVAIAVIEELDNEDRLVGNSPAIVLHRVAEGLKLMSDRSARKGMMRLEGEPHSYTGMYQVRLVDPGFRQHRAKQDGRPMDRVARWQTAIRLRQQPAT